MLPPDGSALPKPYYDPKENAVKLCMNWCQFEGLLTLLATADSVQAYYFEDENGPWADVEGQFTRKTSSRKSKNDLERRIRI